jgi:hypothetical protein
MKRALLLIVFRCSAAMAQHDDHAHDSSTSNGDAQIVVTINPEARISATAAAPMPPPAKCGTPVELKVRIVNQGYVTAPLRVAIVGDRSRRVALHMDTVKLSGRTEDARLVHLIPLSTGATDVTAAFSIHNNLGDQGGRDQVHLLVRCI